MGIVWLARDDELERQVALKFLSEQIIHDPALVADLKRETKRSLELTHPNIVRIHDFVQDARTACICMEYVDGKTLSDVRVNKTNNVFEVPDLEPLVAQWCGAMNYAHTHARVVHCDLKPSNLMLNVKGVLKITDFGIARSLSDSGSRLTVTRGKSGTLVYMSPQQLNGDPPSVFDDIYSMGATLYELLTGKPPFYRGQIDRQIFDKAPPSIAVRRTELGITSPYIVPLQWEDAIAACLAKETIGRPQGALALLERLNLVSPLRVEKPNTPPKVDTGHDSPNAPGEFGLMERDATVDLPVTPPAQRDSPLERRRHVESSREPYVAKNVALTPASVLTTSNRRMKFSVRNNFRQAFEILSVRLDLGRFGRIVAIACVGIASIVALWDVVSSVSRPGTPTVPAKSVSPIPTADQTPTPSAAETPAPSKVPVQTLAPVPKDEATKLKNDLRAAEHVIISVHEKFTVPERLERMTFDGRAKYEKALAALCEGYPSMAESLALEAERAEPGQPLILNLRGVILVSTGSVDEAEALFGRAATIDQSFREAEYNFASAAFKKKEYTRARKRFEHLFKSITAKPNDRLSQLLRYRIYLSLLLEGSVDSAQHLMQEMQLNADTPAPYYAHAAWELRRDDASSAEHWLTQARVQYSVDLNLVFSDALSDMEQVRLTPPPTPVAALTPKSNSDVNQLSTAEPASKNSRSWHTWLDDFVHQYVRMGESNDLDFATSFFAPRVDFFEEGVKPLDSIRRDMEAYNTRWPTRRATIRGEVQILEKVPDSDYAASFQADYHVENPARGEWINLAVSVDLQIVIADGLPQITSLKQKRLRKEEGTMQPKPSMKTENRPATAPTAGVVSTPPSAANAVSSATSPSVAQTRVTEGDPRLIRVTNTRYGFSALIPQNVFPNPQTTFTIDRQTFSSSDGRTTLTFFVQRSNSPHSLKDSYEQWAAQHSGTEPGKSVDYKVLRDDWFVVSGKKPGRGFYVKAVARQDVLAFMYFECDEKNYPVNQETLTAMSRSFVGIGPIANWTGTAQTPTPEPLADPVSEIKALENKWAVSIKQRDVALIETLLADDHAVITPHGRRLDKSGAIDRIKNDTDKYELVVIENMDVRVESPSTALATGLLRERGKAKSGKPFERAYLFTDTWVKLDGRWLCTQSLTKTAMSH